MEKHKRVLITGAHGFLGKHVVKELENNGYHPLTPTKVELNLLDEHSIKTYFSEQHPRAILHLGAVVGGIGANRKNPGRFFYQNIKMGINVIHHSMMEGVKRFVYISTLCEYPEITPIPFKEENIWNSFPEPTNAPYAIAKKALRVMLDAYRDQYGLNSISLIPANMIGGEDHFDLENSHVVPALIRKVQTAIDEKLSSISVWGDGSPTREFLYAGDCARAIRLALESDYNGQEGPINIGTGQEISIVNLVKLICETMGYRGAIVWETDKPNGQPRRCVDTSKAKRILGFEAQTTLEEAIPKVVGYWNEIKIGK